MQILYCIFVLFIEKIRVSQVQKNVALLPQVISNHTLGALRDESRHSTKLLRHARADIWLG